MLEKRHILHLEKQDHFSFSPLKNLFYYHPLGFNPLSTQHWLLLHVMNFYEKMKKSTPSLVF